MSSRDENENENVNENENENEKKNENENEKENENETMSQNEKNEIIKGKNDTLDEIIGNSESFEEQIKSLKKREDLKGFWLIMIMVIKS